MPTIRPAKAINERIALLPTIEPKLPYCRSTQLTTADYARNSKGDRVVVSAISMSQRLSFRRANPPQLDCIYLLHTASRPEGWLRGLISTADGSPWSTDPASFLSPINTCHSPFTHQATFRLVSRCRAVSSGIRTGRTIDRNPLNRGGCLAIRNCLTCARCSHTGTCRVPPGSSQSADSGCTE